MIKTPLRSEREVPLSLPHSVPLLDVPNMRSTDVHLGEKQPRDDNNNKTKKIGRMGTGKLNKDIH